MPDQRLPRISACPYCDFIADEAMVQPEQEIQPGDIALCHACGGLSLFSDELDLRKPTKAEMILTRAGPEWPEVWRAVQALAKTTNRPKPPKFS